ncbi:PDDEXK nuclease domain-containing protein [Capnocytophaga bilenii]
MKKEEVNKNEQFYTEIRQIIETARTNAIRSVDFSRVQMYWLLGKRIFEEEQQGKDRADYGTYLIRNLAEELMPTYGSGFSVRQLKFCRQFYRMYPIGNALRSQLNWTQYRLLIQIEDPCKREYYELESVNNAWTARETERQINAMLYERLLLSNDKESVLAIARKERIPESPTEIIKDPMVLEFLGLHREASYYEKDLEGAILSHLTDFLLEMGKGFSFVARQKRLLLEDDEFFADLQGVKHNAHIPTTKKASKSIKIQVVTIKKSQKAGKTKCTKSYIYMHKMPQKAATFGTNICIIYQRCK